VNRSNACDYIIVGQGLAGATMAMRLWMRGYKIAVFDSLSPNTASAIAAGLFNPVTGRNMVKTWLADELFPSMFKYYDDVERLTRRTFLHRIPLYRPFLSAEEQNEWMGRSTDKRYHHYVSNISTASIFEGEVNDPFGGVTLNETGYLDTAAYLETVRNFLTEKQAFHKQHFVENELEVGENSVCYQKISAQKIIFCQGVHNLSNRWFGYLPIMPLKGETLTIQLSWKNDVILNRGVYMVPGFRRDEWRVGATYNIGDKDPGNTLEARRNLTDRLNELIRIPYTITGQRWGFRPTTPDRKPIIGAHASYKSLIIFNGLGTKGVSLAPYFSEVLVRAMENKGMINKEADVTRFN
jgi:glycine oxidase